MLDVEGKVVGAPDLVLRVRELLRSTELAAHAAPTPAGRGSRAGRRAERAPDVGGLERRARLVHQKQAALRSPDVTTSRGGLVGRGVVQFKRAVRKATWWYVEPRWQVQTQIDAEVAWVTSELVAAVGTMGDAQERLERQLADLRAERELVRAEADAFAADLANLQGQLAETGRVFARQSVAGPPPVDYPAFESSFRGSSAEVRVSQAEYVGFFGPAAPEDEGLVVDVGCGRGEMLELLAEAGHRAKGVELDAGMIAACREKGLDVVEASAVPWLSGVPSGSLKGIFCAQVVEHLPSEELIRFVCLAAEKLRPGGTFVAETIDPRSAHALNNHFWADLSHVRPVHPATLSFLCRQAGFGDIGVQPRARHEAADLAAELEDGPERRILGLLLESVFGYQDYAVIARR